MEIWIALRAAHLLVHQRHHTGEGCCRNRGSRNDMMLILIRRRVVIDTRIEQAGVVAVMSCRGEGNVRQVAMMTSAVVRVFGRHAFARLPSRRTVHGAHSATAGPQAAGTALVPSGLRDVAQR